MPFRLPSTRINWVNSSFLIGSAVTTLTAVPVYLWRYGCDPFQIALFFAFFVATGLSITLGYHRLFAHRAFQARWPVRLGTLVFGAAAFENSALEWVSDHRRHHQHTDHADDPYDISQGFWYAHIGWILFKLNAEPPRDNVPDLERDPLLRWQDRYYLPIAIGVGFVLPAALGWWHAGGIGALGGLLLAGVARITAVQHMTFCINSLCHTIGRRPYSTRCSARDSWLMALFTFGEGYHNYHHEFQHDYRNGVKWWHWDPTKWTIRTLALLRLVRGLRRVPEERILLAQLAEARRQLGARLACPRRPLPERTRAMLQASEAKLAELAARWTAWKTECAGQADQQFQQARAALEETRQELRQALALLKRTAKTAMD
ncbi:MAG: fatty acid desaturase [Opitutae bacterium]|nr:fatty acid desaturase [Opitutae bacterium]